ncbi:hypothetical protein OPT61_g8825 [Boeremia exigua]|uniref:Uncharacterized protein n=1 Tax=Boeremia exigua TaxID=749465 RepID=A0ACC2HWK5_9PLEO|nr:hypothetical protein OPT61_g8825 [Boeremia exigua]
MKRSYSVPNVSDTAGDFSDPNQVFKKLRAAVSSYTYRQSPEDHPLRSTAKTAYTIDGGLSSEEDRCACLSSAAQPKVAIDMISVSNNDTASQNIDVRCPQTSEFEFGLVALPTLNVSSISSGVSFNRPNAVELVLETAYKVAQDVELKSQHAVEQEHNKDAAPLFALPM